jgi:uncharacterized membrane protein
VDAICRILRASYGRSTLSEIEEVTFFGTYLFIYLVTSMEKTMSFLVSAFVVGVACGLRALVGLAAVSWAASSQELPLQGTWLAFIGFRATPFIASLLAVFELVTDKLPKTPSRLVPPQFAARVSMGALTGAVIGISHGSLLMGVLSGIVGSVLGTLAGSRARAAAAQLFGRDLPAALLEDVTAIALVILALR